MQSVMSIGYDCLKSIQNVAKTTGVMPRHALVGLKGKTLKDNESRLAPLNSHFNYLLQLGEVRGTRVIATLVDGVVGRTNRDDTVDMV